MWKPFFDIKALFLRKISDTLAMNCSKEQQHFLSDSWTEEKLKTASTIFEYVCPPPIGESW